MMKSMQGLPLLATLASASLAILAACVGDDASTPTQESIPTQGTGTPDSGSDSGIDASRPDDDGGTEAGHDAAALSCAGQTFGTPTLVGTAQISGALATTMWGIRPVGPNAYFAATPSGGSEQQIFRATYTLAAGGAAPALSNASVIAPSSAAVVEWAPTVSSDSALLVFATAFPGPRNLSYANGAGGTFGPAIPIATLNTAEDESDPWLVGKPTATALYFSRYSGTSMEIWRSAITGGPSFGTPVKITLLCPQSNCGTPVVTPDETTMLYASWAAGGFVPNVTESTLTLASGGGTAGTAVGHPELGARYPSWVSDDGCEVLLGGGGLSSVSDMYYARRTAK